MRSQVISIESRGSGHFQVEYYDCWGERAMTRIYAKDEMDAFVKADAYIRKQGKNMRVAIICVTSMIVIVSTLLTTTCVDNHNRYERNLETCVKAGKSYISEDNSFSCRDPFVRANN